MLLGLLCRDSRAGPVHFSMDELIAAVTDEVAGRLAENDVLDMWRWASDHAYDHPGWDPVTAWRDAHTAAGLAPRAAFAAWRELPPSLLAA